MHWMDNAKNKKNKNLPCFDLVSCVKYSFTENWFSATSGCTFQTQSVALRLSNDLLHFNCPYLWQNDTFVYSILFQKRKWNIKNQNASHPISQNLRFLLWIVGIKRNAPNLKLPSWTLAQRCDLMYDVRRSYVSVENPIKIYQQN